MPEHPRPSLACSLGAWAAEAADSSTDVPVLVLPEDSRAGAPPHGPGCKGRRMSEESSESATTPQDPASPRYTTSGTSSSLRSMSSVSNDAGRMVQCKSGGSILERFSSLRSGFFSTFNGSSDEADSPVLRRLNLLRSGCKSGEVGDCPHTSKILSQQDVPEHASRLHGTVHKVVTSKAFEFTCGAIIFSNAVFIGVISDYEHRHYDTPTPAPAQLAEILFSTLYIIEISLRIFGHRQQFFIGTDMGWNIFDTLLVVISSTDHIISSTIMQGVDLSFLRALKIMKVLKLLRVVRCLRCLKGLRIILNGILGSLHSMSYALILIFVTTFMFATAILQSCTAYLREDAPDEATQESIAEFWSSEPTAMLTLFAASTAGGSWMDFAEPLYEVDSLAVMAFLMYLFFFFFVIANTLTSLFVENSLQFAMADQQSIIQEEMDTKDQHIMQLRRLFEVMDVDGCGSITYDAFTSKLASPQLYAFASSLGIDVLDAKLFFALLSSEGTVSVDVETFVIGCIKMRGQARSVDVINLSYRWEKEMTRNKQRFDKVIVRLETIEGKLIEMST